MVIKSAIRLVGMSLALWASSHVITQDTPLIVMSTSTGRLVELIKAIDDFATGISEVRVIFELQNPYHFHSFRAVESRKNGAYSRTPYTFVSGFEGATLLRDALSSIDMKSGKVVIISDAFAHTTRLNWAEPCPRPASCIVGVVERIHTLHSPVSYVVIDKERAESIVNDISKGIFTSRRSKCFSRLVEHLIAAAPRRYGTIFHPGSTSISLDAAPEVCPDRASELIRNVVFDYLPSDPIVLEAGAYCGDDTRRMAQLWPNGHLHSFEPHPEIYKALSEFTQDLPNISTYNVALADKAGVTYMTPTHVSHGPLHGTGSIHKLTELHKAVYGVEHAQPIEVEIDTIGAWANKNGIDKIDFMWLDMEGGELTALQACLRDKPQLLENLSAAYIELLGRPELKTMDDRPTGAQIREFMKSIGFVEVLTDLFEIGGRTSQSGNSLFVKKELVESVNRPITLGAPCDVPTVEPPR